MLDDEYRVVERTPLPDGSVVSTVWLGLDHGFGRGGPAIFETMVFDSDDWNCDGQRYATEDEARAGHERWTKLRRRRLLALA